MRIAIRRILIGFVITSMATCAASTSANELAHDGTIHSQPSNPGAIEPDAEGAADQVRIPCLATDRPNIVFLMADDHRSYSLGCVGDVQIETPNLDRLASRGVLFQHCYATSPICMASRATVMTGMYEYKTGCNFGTGSLSAEHWNRSYPMLLKKAGYRIAFAGKWGFPLEPQDYAEQFDKWGGFQGSGQGSYTTAKNPSLKPYAKKYPHVTRALGAFGQDFIRESADSSKPFCLSLSFKAPHKPHTVIDPADQTRYANVELATPPNWGQDYLDKLPIQPKLGRQYAQRNSWDTKHFAEHMRAYYQLISGVDTAVGMVIEELARQGLAENTVVIYTSDNGYFCGAHGLQGKVLPYDDSARIPLIIVDPRSPAAGEKQRCRAVVGNIDFAPTILDLAGLPIPGNSDGKSLVPLIDDPKTCVRESMLVIQNWGWINSDHNKALAVATEDWKYIYWCYADRYVPPSEELFELKSDPLESVNRVDDPECRAILDRLRTLYDEHLQAWVEQGVKHEDYARYETIFSRHVPWQEKRYRGFRTRGKSGGSNQKLRSVYRELTGHDAPAK